MLAADNVAVQRKQTLAGAGVDGALVTAYAYGPTPTIRLSSPVTSDLTSSTITFQTWRLPLLSSNHLLQLKQANSQVRTWCRAYCMLLRLCTASYVLLPIPSYSFL